jgi:hypothetical protein
MQPSTPRYTRHAPSGVQSLQAFRVEVKCLECGSSSHAPCGNAGGRLHAAKPDSAVSDGSVSDATVASEHVLQVAEVQVSQFIAPSGLRMCEF